MILMESGVAVVAVALLVGKFGEPNSIRLVSKYGQIGAEIEDVAAIYDAEIAISVQNSC